MVDERQQQLAALISFHTIFNEQGEADERAVAIVGGAFLDNLLERVLSNFMVDDPRESQRLLGVERPLGTYGARVAAAYSFGLICKTVRDDLRIIGKIRNKFAHQLDTSFDQEPIRDWCTGLKWHEFGMMMPPPAGATARMIFEVDVNQLVGHLEGMALLAKGERRKVGKEDAGGPTLLR